MTDEILDQTSPPVATAEKEQRRTRWFLWLQWVLVSAVGAAALFDAVRYRRFPHHALPPGARPLLQGTQGVYSVCNMESRKKLQV